MVKMVIKWGKCGILTLNPAFAPDCVMMSIDNLFVLRKHFARKYPEKKKVKTTNIT